MSDAFSNFQKGPAIPRPNLAESFIPVVGPGWEAVADLQQGDYGGAALNGALAASDLFLAGSIAKGIARGGFDVARGATTSAAPHAWRNMRPLLQKKGFIKAGEEGHHWAIPQNQWGKQIPEWIKNQTCNIKSLDPVTHGRLRHRVGDLPKFNLAEQLWHGTPAWSKAAAGSAAGHAASGVESNPDRSQMTAPSFPFQFPVLAFGSNGKWLEEFLVPDAFAVCQSWRLTYRQWTDPSGQPQSLLESN